jgi:hypothetical protein
MEENEYFSEEQIAAQDYAKGRKAAQELEVCKSILADLRTQATHAAIYCDPAAPEYRLEMIATVKVVDHLITSLEDLITSGDTAATIINLNKDQK